MLDVGHQWKETPLRLAAANQLVELTSKNKASFLSHKL